MQRSSPRRARALARSADPYDLYERSVQDPPRDVAFVDRWFRRYRGRTPLHLREDFCGTAALCAAWVRSDGRRTAEGIDLCPEALAAGRRRHLEPLPASARARVRLVAGDVRTVHRRAVDVTCALNFSYCALHERRDLVRYFRRVRRGLADDGIFVLDVLGGRDAMIDNEERHDHGAFVYVWEQTSFDPLTHRMKAAIHFEFPDGSRIHRAFAYDWRLWTVPELCDALVDAGFARVHRLWERTGRDGEFTGSLYEPKGAVSNEDLWWTYLIAEA
ncbi:MAG: class I SAM-dependent methyltransferase [Deltaproteobacteria bacterium]|nr:MAG: class I SAM-dependent methyltransferase [Deltaproteobacteria bacterium]